MSRILSREEFERVKVAAACDTATPVSDAQGSVDDLVATIDALAATLHDSLTYIDLYDASMRKSASQKVRNAYERLRALREKGWTQ